MSEQKQKNFFLRNMYFISAILLVIVYHVCAADFWYNKAILLSDIKLTYSDISKIVNVDPNWVSTVIIAENMRGTKITIILDSDITMRNMNFSKL